MAAELLGVDVHRLSTAVAPHAIQDGWATIEVERALRELGAAAAAPAPHDDSLGARARTARLPDGQSIVLLEPSTEGLLAAALARYGEGPLVRYLIADAGAPTRAREAGFRLTAERPGPLGPQRLVLGGPRWGPFLVLVSGGAGERPRS